MSATPAVDSPDAAASLAGQLAFIDAGSRQRGAQYHSQGRVISIARVDDQTILGQVRGAHLYSVELIRRGPRWTSTCTCPLTGQCKHVVALAREWLARLRGDGIVPVTGAAQPAARVTFREQWEPILAHKLGRSLTSEEGAFLGRLAQTFHNFRQHGGVSPWDIERLGFATDETRNAGRYGQLYGDWWGRQPPRDPLELWQYIALDLEGSGINVPPFMRPVTDTATLKARQQERLRRQAIERWTNRLKSLEPLAAGQALEAIASPKMQRLDLRVRLGEKWLVELRDSPDAPWKPAPRSLLERFAHTEPGSLATIDASSAVFALLAVCQEHGRRNYGRVSLEGLDGADLLHRMLSHPIARTLVVQGSGAPLEFSAEPVTWEIARSASQPRDYEISLKLPGGAPLPPSAKHLPGPPDLYLHNGVVYRGPPALDGASAAAAIAPAEVIEDPQVLALLRRFGPKLPAEIETRFVTVPLRARIEGELLSDEFSGYEMLALRLLATSEQPPIDERFERDGWTNTAEHAPREATGKILSLDFAAADRAAAHLRELTDDFDYEHRAWMRRLTKTLPEEFLVWRETLPKDVEILATGELASLLDAPVRASVSLELSESEKHRDWFDLALALQPKDSTLTPAEIALLLRARGKLVRLPGKGWRRLLVELDGAPAAAMEAAGFERETIAEAALAGERQRFHALQLAQGALVDLLPQRQAEALRGRAREIASPAPAKVPASLRAELRPYQREGFHFLAFLSANRLGGVLADDMGLGKTVQTLAWLLWLAEQQPKREPLRVLIVCPKSVVGNWEAETARFAPTLVAVRFTPKLADAQSSTLTPQLVLANYTQLRLNGDFFRSQRWHAVVLDEGQFIKTPTSKVAQIARELPGEHRLILTGTPIENRLLDLWSLFAFAVPGLLGPQAAFKRHYAPDNPLALTRLRARVRHFLLRRTKAQVAADLPPRTEEDVLVELEGEQATLYQAELKRARAQLLKVETPRQFDKARFNILASLLRLRQICCHPGLIDAAHRAAPSAKLDELMERVEELAEEGHQVLVFSQFVEMLELIRGRLVDAGIPHLMLTGQTENRDDLVRQFQSETRQTVFLLSLKAAGFGLNLTAASYVILYDPWWNPAVEAQAIDRTHRIGQTVPVNAYRLIARGTVEEKIRALQREKAALAGAIVQEESLSSVLDLDSLRRILA